MSIRRMDRRHAGGNSNMIERIHVLPRPASAAPGGAAARSGLSASYAGFAEEGLAGTQATLNERPMTGTGMSLDMSRMNIGPRDPISHVAIRNPEKRIRPLDDFERTAGATGRNRPQTAPPNRSLARSGALARPNSSFGHSRLVKSIKRGQLEGTLVRSLVENSTATEWTDKQTGLSTVCLLPAPPPANHQHTLPISHPILLHLPQFSAPRTATPLPSFPSRDHCL